MRQETAGTRRATRRACVLVVAGLLLGAVVTPVAQVGAAAPAAAASADLGPVSASFTAHRGTTETGGAAGTADGNCIRYSPVTANGTGWSTNVVATGHGQQRIETYQRRLGFGGWSGWSVSRTAYDCPATLGTTSTSPTRSSSFGTVQEYDTTGGQSSLGFAPEVLGPQTTGRSFLLGTVRHHNNPISASGSANYFRGTLGLRLGDGVLSPTGARFETSVSYRLYETPATVYNGDDEIIMSGLRQTTDVVIAGRRYQLTVQGLTRAADGAASCPAAPTSAFTETFLTVESATTLACVWARLDVVRDLQVVNVVEAAGAPPVGAVPTMSFRSSSTVAASPWSSTPKVLTPSSTVPGSNSASVTGAVQGGETVQVTRPALASGWELTRVSCADAATPLGPAVASFDPVTGVLAVTDLPAPPAGSTAPVVCTFVHTYVAPTTITLVSRTTTGTTTARAAGWGFSVRDGSAVIATGTTSGTSPELRVESLGSLGADRSVTVEEAVPAGYVADRVTCTSTQPGVAPLVTGNPVSLPLVRGWSYTCTVDNLTTGVTVTKEAFSGATMTEAQRLVPGVQRTAGTTVHWRYTVRNTGQATLDRVRLQDDVTATTHVPAATTQGRTTITCPGIGPAQVVTIPTIAPGASVVCTASGVM